MTGGAAQANAGELPLWRTRQALLLVSLATIGLQLALMRALSMQLWSHLAYLVIGVALLGFGASGTALTLLRPRVLQNPRGWLTGAILLLSLSMVVAPRVAQLVELDVQFLAWDLAQAGGILVLELVILVPFLLAGGAIGIALMDRSERLGGHYAANLVGSGLGAFGAVLAMDVWSTGALFTVMAAVALLGAVLVSPSHRRFRAAAAAVVLAGGLLTVALPWQPAFSPYKALPQFLDMPGTEVLHRREGPLGRLAVVAGPSVRLAPGLSLGFVQEIPPHVLILSDGDASSPLYDVTERDHWRFMDHTTRAAPFYLTAAGSVLVIGAGGGSDLGLARYHGAQAIVGLEMNPQLVELIRGPLHDRGGRLLDSDGVTVLIHEARGYLAGSRASYDIIQLPALDAFGVTGSGLHAAQESYLYTVEAFDELIARLNDGGILAITRWARTPPRDELRAWTTAIEALRRSGREPDRHVAMIRNWATVTILVGERPFDQAQQDALRAFCADRGFDLCYLPDLDPAEANRFHVLDGPVYADATRTLLGPQAAAFIAGYLFDIAPATDDRPYFFRTLRWTSLPELHRQFGAHGRAFLELGSLMSAAALVQGIAVGLVLILLPLCPVGRGLRGVPRRLPVLVYFLMLGAGFMLLEIGFLQKLILYLAHPIYAAAAVIAAFLVFSGLGSLTSSRWQARTRTIALAAVVVAALGLLYVVLIDDWLALSRAEALGVRLAIACLSLAPLAFAMGLLFPLGLAAVSRARPALVPWAWAANGFASVTATVACPLIAAEVGFGAVLLLAVACYLLAGLSARGLR